MPSWAIRCTTRGTVFSPCSTSPFQGLCAFTFHIILRLLLHSLYKETAMQFTFHALTLHPILLPVLLIPFFLSVQKRVKYLILPILNVFFIYWPHSWQLKSICALCLYFPSQILPFSLLAAQSPPHSCLSCGHPQWMLVRQPCHYTAGQRDRHQYIATLLPLLICRGTQWGRRGGRRVGSWVGRWKEEDRKERGKNRSWGLPSFSQCCLIYKPIGF